MKLKLLLVIIAMVFFLPLLATVVVAQEEVPAPYAGQKNPFPWDDAAAQESGGKIFKSACSGCHGSDGGNIAEANFSAPDFPQKLEEMADHYLWILSEGRLDKGMPPYKSSLSEEQRWQVLTYLWSLGKEPAPPVTSPPTTEPPTREVNGKLLLLTPEAARSGQPLSLTVYLRDEQDRPIGNAAIKFFTEVDFFTNGLIELGEALTDDEGRADFVYTPRREGNIQIVARYNSTEATTTITLTGANEGFYEGEAGIGLPAPGQEVFIGPESSRELGKMGEAPTSAFRLPGGIVSWLLVLVATVILIWVTYFRALYQVFRIPVVTAGEETNTRLVPLVALAVVIFLGMVLVLMLITGPYSHFHLLRW